MFSTEITSLASHLAGNELDATNMAHLLRWLGCRGSAFGLGERLELFENLLPDFELLVKRHPNFEPARGRLLSALELQGRLPNFAQSSRRPVRGATNFAPSSLSQTPL